MLFRHTLAGFATLASLLNSLSCAPKQGGVIPPVAAPSSSRSVEPIDTSSERESPCQAPARPLGAPSEPISTPAEGKSTPGTALAEFASNKFEGPWTVSLISLEPVRPAFGKGDRVKAKASRDGPTMTVEYVPIPTAVDARYYSKAAERLLVRYRCRWKNEDGSASTGFFQEEELEAAPVGG
jgi:uncharacterized protein YodC (DUF2158 family)